MGSYYAILLVWEERKLVLFMVVYLPRIKYYTFPTNKIWQGNGLRNVLVAITFVRTPLVQHRFAEI